MRARLALDAEGLGSELHTHLLGAADSPLPSFGSGVTDALRNAKAGSSSFLSHLATGTGKAYFGTSAGEAFDLPAWSIMRARERGMSSYNEYRRLFNYPPKTFAEDKCGGGEESEVDPAVCFSSDPQVSRVV